LPLLKFQPSYVILCGSRIVFIYARLKFASLFNPICVSPSPHLLTQHPVACLFEMNLLTFLQAAHQIFILLCAIFYYHCDMFRPMLIIM